MTVPATPILPQPLDLKAALATLARHFPQTDKIDNFSAKLAERPAQNTLMTVGLSAVLFYMAERNHNPKVNTIFDALEYCSSSLSVGYTNIYPQTPLGKLVASTLMTYGPALSNAILDGPKEISRADSAVTQQKILATLEQILSELKKQQSP
jgi:hypothetical protein